MARSEFTEALVKRLRIRRNTAEGDVYVLDLRHRRFGNKSTIMVRNPIDPGWPLRGRPTADLKTAQRWTREHYAPQLEQELEARKVAPDAGTLTVQQACEQYVAHRLTVLGPGALRSINSRVSLIRRHILPAFGSMPLAALTRQMVRSAVDNMVVTKPGRRPGKRVSAPAELGTKRNFLRSLGAVWQYAFPDVASPFAGVRLVDEEGAAARRRAIETGDFSALLAPESGALTPSEFRQALVGAKYYDLELGHRPNTKMLMFPNTTYAMVIQTALGLRISEVRMLRWGHINFDDRYVLITGTKTRRSFRVVPLQEQLVPWLEELKAIEGGDPDPRTFVIRTDPRRSSQTAAAQTTLVNRYARALKYSGMKRPKKSTHWARATHATWGAASPVVTTEALKAYLGHQTRYGGSTDAYVHVMLEIMPDEHRRYITHIPTPEVVRAMLKNFTPVDIGSWRERRVWQSRSNVAIRQQRARALARKPRYASLASAETTPNPAANPRMEIGIQDATRRSDSISDEVIQARTGVDCSRVARGHGERSGSTTSVSSEEHSAELQLARKLLRGAGRARP